MIGMARPPRVHFPGAIYHVRARGVDGQKIFFDDRDRISFLKIMRRIEAELSVRIIAYCLMNNHFHFAIQVSSVALSTAMQRLLTSYCMGLNRRHDRTGHVFGGRHKASLCTDDRYLTALIRYIHMNPVRAGLVKAPGDWPWSSYVPGEVIGTERADFDPWPKDPREVDMMRIQDGAMDLDGICSKIVELTGIQPESMRSDARTESIVSARKMFVTEAVRGGHTSVSAARWLNISSRTACRYVRDHNVMLAGLTPTTGVSAGLPETSTLAKPRRPP